MRCLVRLTFGAVLLCSTTARATVCEFPQVLVVLDRSGSMKELAGGQSKWKSAITAVDTLVQKFAGQISFGLMLFPRWPHVDHCTTGSVNVQNGLNTPASVFASLLATVYPEGDTPSTASLQAAKSYLQGIKVAKKPQVVVLVTDGKETCSTSYPATATAGLLAGGIKTFVVGFGAGVDAKSLQDAAKAGGTGTYHQTNDLAQLTQALTTIVGSLSCCGNGTLDAGELCDTAIPAGQLGACPKTSTDCDDKNACTTDTVAGTACQAQCSHQNTCTELCGNGVLDAGEACDSGIAPGKVGACPQSATDCDDKNPSTIDSLTGTGCDKRCKHDPQPQALCGNGKVDPGEWCDTAIAAGKPGACPTSCSDGDACTSDVLLGTGCLAYCAFLPVTSPKHGDGCCPKGASAKNDSDCPASCGNGLLEAAETCDPGIAVGQPGACPTSCNDNDACTEDVIGGSACQPACIHNPKAPNAKVKDGCCPKGMTAAQDADCQAACTPDSTGHCVDDCAGVSCKDGQYCKAGACIPWPASTSPAAPDEEGAAIDGGCACHASSARHAGSARLEEGLPWLLVGLALAWVRIRRRTLVSSQTEQERGQPG